MLLMSPNPAPIEDRVSRSLLNPVIPQYQEDFVKTYDETSNMLKHIFGTSNDVIILPGSGRMGIESSIVSTLEDGDNVLCLVNGVFGSWMADICQRVLSNVTVVEFPMDSAIDPRLVNKALKEKKYDAVTIVHVETSTGVRNPINEIASILGDYDDTLLIVDTVSSLGAEAVNVDKYNIDLCISASQKALGCVLGLTPISVSNRAWKKMNNRNIVCRSYSLDLLRWKNNYINRKEIRPGIFPVIPSTHLIYALNQACSSILEEGIESRIFRTRVNAEAFRHSIKSIGLELFSDEKTQSNSVTGVKLPDNFNDKALITLMKEKHNVLISGGVFSLSGALFRVAHMGLQANPSFMIPCLIALEKSLLELGYKLSSNQMISAYLSKINQIDN